jgi:hypothetical protein
MPNPATMNAARIMWMVWCGVAGLNIAFHRSTPTTWSLSRWNPRGSFIQALAETTKKAAATPATHTGMPVSRWILGGSRSHAYR